MTSAGWKAKTQFATLNAMKLLGVAGAVWLGWIDRLWNLDPMHLSVVIGVLFLAGLVISAAKIWDVSHRLDHPEMDIRGVSAKSLEIKLMAQIGVVRHIANTLMMVGLTCTVLGLIQSMLSIDPSQVGDSTAAAHVIGQMLVGIGAALCLSLVALVASLWVSNNYQILRTATLLLLARQIKDRV